MNMCILVSRNKREGWYFGPMKFYNSDYKHARTWSKPSALRYKHIQFGKVNFADLGIKLSTIEEVLDGQT